MAAPGLVALAALTTAAGAGCLPFLEYVLVLGVADDERALI